jgi:hypothetical protein
MNQPAHLLQAEEVAVHALAVRSPGRVLSMPGDRLAEQLRAVLVLRATEHKAHGCADVGKIRTIWSGSSIASAHALLSLLAVRMTSVRPSAYLRVAALS